jgi:hypothetical protein
MWNSTALVTEAVWSLGSGIPAGGPAELIECGILYLVHRVSGI